VHRHVRHQSVEGLIFKREPLGEVDETEIDATIAIALLRSRDCLGRVVGRGNQEAPRRESGGVVASPTTQFEDIPRSRLGQPGDERLRPKATPVEVRALVRFGAEVAIPVVGRRVADGQQRTPVRGPEARSA
jgi:hypothetical protein